MKRATTRTAVAVLALALLAALTGCKREAGKPLEKRKGVYEGKPDTGLSEDQRKILRERALQQGQSGL